MMVGCVALATRVARLQAFLAGLLGIAFCLLAVEVRAQGVTIGGLGDNQSVCTDGTGKIKACGGATSSGNISATGTITAGFINTNGIESSDDLFVKNGHNAFIEGSAFIGDGIGNDTLAVKGTLTTSGKATLDSLEVTKNAEVKGKLTADTLQVDNGANITGGINNNGGGITSAGAISGATDISSSGSTILGDGIGNDMLTVNASSTFNGKVDVNGTLTATTLNATGDASVGGTLSVTGLTKTQGIENTGDFSNTGNAKIDGNASVGGNLTVTGASNLSGGATIGNHLTVLPATTVNMGGNVVHGVADPEVGSDAANKQYVDAGLSRAFRDIDRNTQGIAIAMAMGGMALPDSKNFALGANLGFFDSKQAIAIQGAMRLTPFVSVNGGIGMGVDDSSTLGGRVGVQVAW